MIWRFFLLPIFFDTFFDVVGTYLYIAKSLVIIPDVFQVIKGQQPVTWTAMYLFNKPPLYLRYTNMLLKINCTKTARAIYISRYVYNTRFRLLLFDCFVFYAANRLILKQ